MRFVISALSPQADIINFDCGEPLLNDYLKSYCSQDAKRGLARIFAATELDSPSIVLGFYTLSAASVAADSLPDHIRKRLPRYPIPVALLGRLAVSRAIQGKGLGAILLADACKRVIAASETLAVAAIVVDAKSSEAARFYQHHGFQPLPAQPGRWMLTRSQFSGLA
jgi:GNAT superfamily N-acetyltransferase